MHRGTLTESGSRGNPASRLVGKTERLAYRRRIKALRWTQNDAARAIGRNPGLFSRWLCGKLASAPIRAQIDAVLEAEERRRRYGAA